MSSGIDIHVMREIVARMFVPVTHNAFGESGTSALRDVLEFLPRRYATADPVLIRGTLLVTRSITTSSVSAALQGPSTIETRIERLPRQVNGLLVLELLDTGGVRVWQDPVIDIAILSAMAIVYRFTPGREEFVIKNSCYLVLNPAPEHISVFARPTFQSLGDALQDFKRASIRTSTCYIFREVWDTDKRLFFSPGPEWRMRRSLQQYLRNRLRDVDVHAEQNVDESHPVDVKVLWNFTRSEALIEIKWLGKSRHDGKIVAYWDERAREGAKQLADYLDKYHTSNPNVEVKGYLVVIDGRRYGLADHATAISYANGMHYERRDIDFDPKYHETRQDIEPPLRMFAEPVCEAEGRET